MTYHKITSKLLIVDDHKMIVDGLKLLLRHSARLIFEAYEETRAIAIVKEEQPDLAIVDYRLGHYIGDNLVREIRYHSPHTRILAYSFSADEETVLKMADAGAHGFIEKNEREDEILKAVDTLLKGQIYFDERSCSYLTNRLHPITKEDAHSIMIGDQTFTAKEVELIHLLGMELSAKEIGRQIFLSEHTVEQYKSRIAKRIGAKNAVGILKYALKHGLIRPEEL